MANDRRIRFSIGMPTGEEQSLCVTKGGVTRSAAQLKNAITAEERRRWRALVFEVKAKLEAVESGIVTFEDEFLAQTVLPDNSTVGESIQPGIQHAYMRATCARCWSWARQFFVLARRVTSWTAKVDVGSAGTHPHDQGDRCAGRNRKM